MRTVACFGDSLIFGFPYGPKESWIAEVEAETGVTMLNYGVCGDCCDDIVYRLKNMYLPEQVEAVLFWGGANDILNGRPQGFVIDDLKRAAEFCAAKNGRWLLCCRCFRLTMILTQGQSFCAAVCSLSSAGKYFCLICRRLLAKLTENCRLHILTAFILP